MDSSRKQRYTRDIKDIIYCQICLSPYHSKCQTNVLHCASCNLRLNASKSKIKEKINIFYIFPHKAISAISF